MRRRGIHRDYATDLLARPPSTEPVAPTLSDLLIDPAAQVRALAALVDQDLLSREEFDEAKQRTLRGWR